MEATIYQELVRRAMQDNNLASYLTLYHACQEIMQAAPQTAEQLATLDSEAVLSNTLARLGEAITRIMSHDEFYFYTPESAPQVHLLKEVALQERWKQKIH